MDPMEEIKKTFFIECEELLEAMQDGLQELDAGDGDIETVNTVFRAVHSIKGGAAAFSLTDLVRFAHKFETTLDEVRAERLEASQDVMRVLLRAADLLSDLVAASRDGTEVDGERIDAQLADLAAFVGAQPEVEEEPVEFQPLTLDFGDEPGGDVEISAPRWQVGFKPFPQLYERGNEPALLLRELAELGEATVRCDMSDVPELDAFDPTHSYLVWAVEIDTDASETALREVFDFVEGDCDLSIKPLGSDAPDTLPDLPDLEPIAEEEEGAVSAPVEAPGAEVVELKPGGASPGPSPKAAATAGAASATKSGGAGGTVRVDLERVDRLINLVGELVINQAMLSQSVMEASLGNAPDLMTGLDEFKHLTREVQESVLAIRAQPVKSLFQRMSRIVREAADATGKSVRLETEGEMTEVDKTVIERLADPLTHMIRNAVDHGLESPEKRAASGKDSEGVVRLTAAHRSGRVLIEISDDGAGVNRERVREIAVDKGLIPADANLSNSDIDNLLFMPGFSTAKEVSDLSGRGVGMDVVKRSIAALGGRISITSTPGQGTIFSISLPLTLAILDGMIVTVGDETVVVPLSAILEMLKPDAKQIHALGQSDNVIQVRGEFVPVIDIAEQLGFRRDGGGLGDRVILLIETSDGGQRAFVVDAIQEQRQVVIKGLEENYGQVPGIAAATILGDGRIALILDPDAIVTNAALMGGMSDMSFAHAG